VSDYDPKADADLVIAEAGHFKPGYHGGMMTTDFIDAALRLARWAAGDQPDERYKPLLEKWQADGGGKLVGKYEADHPDTVAGMVAELERINTRPADWAKWLVWHLAFARQQVATRSKWLAEEIEKRAAGDDGVALENMTRERDELRKAVEIIAPCPRCDCARIAQECLADLRRAALGAAPATPQTEE
jgi:hypothetical protein